MAKKRGRPPKQHTAEELLESIRTSTPSIDAEQILFGVMKHVGGIDKFCAIMAKMLKGTGKGSATTKARATGIIADLTKFYTNLMHERTPLPQDLSNEELEAAIQDSLTKIRLRQEAKAAREARESDLAGASPLSPETKPDDDVVEEGSAESP